MNAQKEIISKYGLPDNVYQAKHCELWQVQKDFAWFPTTKIFINKDFKKKLYNAFKELETNNLQSEIKTFDGCFQQRTVRGSDMISLHSWAMAIDINASTEKLGQVKSTLSPKFIEIMLKNGLFWGGNYKGRKDPMHFSLYNG